MKKERLNKYINCPEDYLVKIGSTKLSKRKLLKKLLQIRNAHDDRDGECDSKIVHVVDNIASHIQDAEFDLE